MDIFKKAEELDWKADYYDYMSGYIYHISTAPDKDTILVSFDGKVIGQVTRKKDES